MPHKLTEYINKTLFPRIGVKTKGGIHINSARHWMKREGFRYTTYKKGMYVDGHEREDVVAYRLPLLLSLRPQMIRVRDRSPGR